MDGPGFDQWTRRRFGQAAGGVAASAFATFGLVETEAKKKRNRRRKRCKRHLEPCQQGGKRKCCGDLLCDFPGGVMGTQTICCKTRGKPCAESTDCCIGLCCGGLAEQVCSLVCP
jgi:hypothetical protein